MSDIENLLEIMRALRAPGSGCPWDREQTMKTIVPHTLEEAYEVADVIENKRWAELPGELGDLLFQVVFYCQIGAEQGLFDIDDVVRELEDKLTRRHPHVFGGGKSDTADDVAALWERAKSDERRYRKGEQAPSELDDVPTALPALTRARKLQKRAAGVGFDWPNVSGAWHKVSEELDELRAATGAAVEDEVGDLLFACVNVARHLGVDPEAALRYANGKFERRFRFIEGYLAATGETPANATLETMNGLWMEAKAREISGTGKA